MNKSILNKCLETIDYEITELENKKDIDKAIQALKNVYSSIKELRDIPTNSGRPKKFPYERFQDLRQRGFTQEEIGQKLRVSLSTVRRYWK